MVTIVEIFHVATCTVYQLKHSEDASFEVCHTKQFPFFWSADRVDGTLEVRTQWAVPEWCSKFLAEVLRNLIVYGMQNLYTARNCVVLENGCFRGVWLPG
jgi:hypothetical protein